jgi:hypothetical protein
MMEVDGEEEGMSDGLSDGMPDGLPDGLADSLPDGLGQELQEGMDASIDPEMLQAGHLGSTYSNMGGLPFGSGLSLASQGRQMPHSVSQFRIPGSGQQRLESVTQSLGTVEQEVWQNRHDQQPDGLLPWPGNMASMYRQGNVEDGGHGFDDAVNGER